MSRTLRRLSAGAAAWLLAATIAGPAMAGTGPAPDPPTNVSARAGDRMAEVTWDAPAPDDPSITGYTVTASPPDAVPVTVDQTTRNASVTGLTNGIAYTFTVVATNPDGSSPPSHPSAPVTPGPPGATTLTLTAAPTSIPYGGIVRLSGTLREARTGAGIAAETVIVEQRRAATTTWSTLATATTAGDGTIDPAPQVAPQASTDYRLRHPATPFHAASTSSTASVRVGMLLTARLNRTSMALGRTASIAGQVVPAQAGQRIRLQQKARRTWRTVQTRTLPGSGRFSFALRPRATGTTWWRIHQAGDTDHVGAVSQRFRLEVYRAAIGGILADAAGDDRRNLNGEYVLVRNTGAATINLGGWKLDAGDRSQRFTLAGYRLRPRATVHIHTGHGTTRAGHLFLGSGRPIWNNDGDTGSLIDPHNLVVSRYRY